MPTIKLPGLNAPERLRNMVRLFLRGNNGRMDSVELGQRLVATGLLTTQQAATLIQAMLTDQELEQEP